MAQHDFIVNSVVLDKAGNEVALCRARGITAPTLRINVAENFKEAPQAGDGFSLSYEKLQSAGKYMTASNAKVLDHKVGAVPVRKEIDLSTAPVLPEEAAPVDAPFEA